MRRVLVTRPEPGASLTAHKLGRMGLEAVVLPLTRIVALEVTKAVQPAAYAAVAVTSPNAARHLPATWAHTLRDIPTFAVGKTTGEASRAAALNVVDESAGDATGLRRIIAQRVKPGAQVLVLCGHVRREVLEDGLIEDGFRPRLLETYDTIATPPEDGGASVLCGTPIDFVLVYSAFAADELTRLIAGREDHGAVRAATFIAISERIRSHLLGVAADRVVVAAEPNEEAMLSLL